MLGHDKPSTTLDYYADLFDDDLDDVAARLDAARTNSLLRTRSGSAVSDTERYMA